MSDWTVHITSKRTDTSSVTSRKPAM